MPEKAVNSFWCRRIIADMLTADTLEADMRTNAAALRLPMLE